MQRIPRALTTALILLWLSSTAWCQATTDNVDVNGGSVRLEVAAGEFDRKDVLVITELPRSLSGHEYFTLTRIDNGQSIPVQVQPGEKPTVVWILHDDLQAGKVRQYRLAASNEKPTTKDGVTVQDDGRRLTVKVGQKPVLVYNQAIVPSPDPDPIQSCYAKSGYIHPVYSPSGSIVTDDFNPDHAHQHGIMFAWRETTFEGRSTNGWDQKTGTGKVEHVELLGSGSGPVFGYFDVLLGQFDLTAPSGLKPVLDEIWRVRVYRFSDRFLFDLESTQTCSANAPVVVNEMHYGGLMIRGHADWQEHKNFDYVTSEGKTKLNGNHTRPCWAGIFGPVDGKMAGVTILDHPANFRFPQPVRLHPSMPYFCFVPALLGSFTIEHGEPFVSRYRFSVRDGEPDRDSVDRLWQDYAHPVTVTQITRSDRTEDVAFIADCDGSTQKYVLVHPKKRGQRQPLTVLIALHGHGADRWQFVRDSRDECRAVRDVASAHGMLLVSPDYRAKTSWMGPKAEADVVQIIETLKREFRIDRVIVSGGSMGGTGALTFAAQYPELVDGVVSLNGTADLVHYKRFADAIAESFGGSRAEIPDQYRRRSAVFSPEKFTMPLVTTTGGRDTFVPPESALRLVADVKKHNPNVLSIHRPQGGHSTNYEDTRKALEFVIARSSKERNRD